MKLFAEATESDSIVFKSTFYANTFPLRCGSKVICAELGRRRAFYLPPSETANCSETSFSRLKGISYVYIGSKCVHLSVPFGILEIKKINKNVLKAVVHTEKRLPEENCFTLQRRPHGVCSNVSDKTSSRGLYW